MLTVRPAQSRADYKTARRLFLEYRETPGVAVCVTGFAAEVEALPAGYLLILLAEIDGDAVGCVALRELGGEAEMKRLYVRASARGTGAGRRLAESMIAEARNRGYRFLRLDTLPSMTAAAHLYELLGFQPRAPYSASHPDNARCYELSLGDPSR